MTDPDSPQPSDAERVAAVAAVLRHTADLVDREDLPQTAGDTADFHDGARWATAEVRRIADQVTSEDPEWRPDGLAGLAAGFGLTEAERAMLRYALEVIEDKMASECDEFTDAEDEAVTSLKQLATEPPIETPPPDYTESVDYQVVGDWGVDGAETAEGARTAVAKWLRAWPKCGARAEQRIVRDWPDGSEFYGPWTPLAGD